MKKSSLKQADLDRVVTVGILLEYTDEFLIPKIADIVDETVNRVVDKKIDEKVAPLIDQKNAELKYELKTYIDDKLADQTADIFKRMDREYQKKPRVLQQH